MNEIANIQSSVPYPKANSNKELADSFATYFKEKIDRISSDLDSIPVSSTPISSEQGLSSGYTEFSPLSPAQLKKLILATPSKTCSLDPLPTPLLKESLDECLPILVNIVNTSLEKGQMPKALKRAIITPVPKKANIQEYTDFRPISNLPFLSKLIERVVVDQLTQYCDNNGLNEPLQSAYRSGHSTETALLKVTNDILLNMDTQEVTLLTLLDLSAAFDTIPHNLFVERLQKDYGISGAPLEWFRSYFTDRQQQVVIEGVTSDAVPLDTGMPQGSGLGPWGYTKYNKNLGQLIRMLLIIYHMFADDSQLYTKLNPRCPESQIRAKEKLENCLNKVSDWMTANRLKLNGNKTEFIPFGTKAQLSKLLSDEIRIGNETIKASICVRDLGVMLDNQLKMDMQIKHILKKCYTNLRRIKAIRPYLTLNATKSLVLALVMSHLDYCNSLLIGISCENINKLQAVQNAAARIVYRLKKYDHVSHVRKKLHWLPIRERINYKIAVITFNGLYGNGPQYLKELLKPLKSVRSLRSGNQKLLDIPKTRLKTAGDRAFATTAPKIWNELPMELRNCENVLDFKRKLKTHLFRKAYIS